MKLRIFHLDTLKSDATSNEAPVIPTSMAFELGQGVHKAPIRSIVWTQDPNILVTAADKIRWWDLKKNVMIQEQDVVGDIGTCEFNPVISTDPNNIGAPHPVLSVAAGKTVYFFGGPEARELLKSVTLPYEVASVAIHVEQRKFVTGGVKDTWAKVYDYDAEEEIGKSPAETHEQN